jgi:hypothetical protein
VAGRRQSQPLREREIKIGASYVDTCNLQNLGTVWRKLKRLVRGTDARDPIDLLDWQSKIDINLKTICEELQQGNYHPAPPARHNLAKTKGAFRTITSPNLKDVLVFRLICEVIHQRALASKVKGAFFVRSEGMHPLGPTHNIGEGDYPSSFEVWKRFSEYRSRTLLSGENEYLVITDISNFFDSISHDLLAEYLAPLGVHREMMGTLGRLLDALKPTTAHSKNPGIGIPVDQYDCSRTLAHVFLFEHDWRVAHAAGEENYVRWMDDQNIGVDSATHGRRIIHLMTESLASQRLTLNSGKTKILAAEEAIQHFQVEANVQLADFEQRWWPESQQFATPADLAGLRADFEETWARVVLLPEAGEGTWDKILKRAYRLALRARSPVLLDSASENLVGHPDLAERIFSYVGSFEEGQRLIPFFKSYVDAGESMHESVEMQFFDALMGTLPSATTVGVARAFCRSYLERAVPETVAKDPACSSAVLAMYWFGSSAESIGGLVQRGEGPSHPPGFARAWLSIMTALEPENTAHHQRKMLGNPHTDVLHLADFISDLRVLNQIPAFIQQRWNPIRGNTWFEPRTWLQADLCSTADSGPVKNYIRNNHWKMDRTASTMMDRPIADRIRLRLQ